MPAATRDICERLAREHLERARVLKTDTNEQMLEALQNLTQSIMYNPLLIPALLMRANLETRLGRYQAAITDFSVAIQAEEFGLDRRRLAAAYAARGNAYRKIQKVHESIMDFAKASEVEPDNGTWIYELGFAYNSLNCTTVAQHFFETALGDKVSGRMSDNVRFRALGSLGMCKLSTGDINGAISVLEKGLEMQNTAQLNNLLGIAYFTREEHKLALQHFLRALELDGICGEYHINVGVCNFHLGEMQMALTHFDDAILRSGKRAIYHFYRASASLMLRMFPQAHVDMDEAISLEPTRAANRYVQALIFIEEGDYDAAQRELQVAVSLNDSLRTAWVHLGLIHYLQSEHFAAIHCFSRAFKLMEADPLVHELVGLVYVALGYHDLAVKSFTRCIDLQPDVPLYYFRRGVARIVENDMYGALCDIEVLKEKFNWREAPAMHALSVALRLLGRSEEALEAANTAVEGNWRNHRYLFQRAECYFDLQNYTGVIDDAQSIIQLGHGNAELLYLRGRSYYALLRFADAVADFLGAAKMQPRLYECADFNFALGVAYANAGQIAAAAAALSKAIEQCAVPPTPFFNERAKVLQQLGDAAGALADLNIVLREDPSDMMALLRRSFAHKALGQYSMAAMDFETAKALDTADGVLASVPYDYIFDIEYVLWTPDPL